MLDVVIINIKPTYSTVFFLFAPDMNVECHYGVCMMW